MALHSAMPKEALDKAVEDFDKDGQDGDDIDNALQYLVWD